MLLGVRAVIAESFERIHRSNLVNMGVLPLQFSEGDSAASLGLDGSEVFDLPASGSALAPRSVLTVHATGHDGRTCEFTVVTRIDTPEELTAYRHGGILPYMLRRLS
jgi:aconitate hydratase